MAGNELAIRFTEEKYATKNDVIRELKISTIDTFWSNILQYRSQFNHYLTIKSIDKNMLCFCGCPSINSAVNNLENKLIRYNRDYSRLSNNRTTCKYFENRSFAKCLDGIAKLHQLEVDDHYLLSIVNGDVQESIPSHQILINYQSALTYIYEKNVNSIDEDFLGELYSKLLGVEELTAFYRDKEDTSRDNRILIDRRYTCAPVMSISPMMESLFRFIQISTLPPTVKATTTYFYINYIKPFDKYSDEIALLMAKSVIAHESIGDLGALFPIETLMSDDAETVGKLFFEIQKTNDITYFINYAIKYLNEKVTEALDDIVNINTNTMIQDAYKPDISVAHVEEAKEPEVAPVEEKQDVIKESKPVVIDEEPKEENIDEAQEDTVVEQKEIILPPQSKKTLKVSYVQEELAVSYIPVALDEKQATLLENDLLESDPSLRKHEAHFYARHCTKGKKYTIAQYKKSAGCAYETARTALDHLAELGYYRKEKIKNKFVYSPIQR